MILFLPWIPIATALVLMCIPKEATSLLKNLAIGACSICFLILLSLIFSYDTSNTGFQFVQRFDWVPDFGISYAVGLDGINLTLCLLHGLVSVAGVFVSCWPKERLKEYLIFYLILVGAIYGVFTALDMFLLYLFYEITLVPLFPMIGIWGSKNKEYGAMKLTLFITTGAVLCLFGIIVLYKKFGLETFDLITLQQLATTGNFTDWSQSVIAGFLLIGFGVIASLWPFHSWSPIGYAAAPTAVSMLHAGVLKKMGPYLMLRLAVAFLPEGVASWSQPLAILAGIGIIYAAYAAIKQTDLKFIIGFSSVSHMGYILLAIAAMTPTALSGAVVLMFSHGVMAAATFACIGFIYEQSHARDVHDFGGLVKKIPFVGLCFIMASFASLGLPGFSNFAAELMIFIGSWKSHPAIVCFAVFGILITALYLLRAVKHIFYGEFNQKWAGLSDANTWAEKFPFVLLLGALILFGLWPQGLLQFIQPSIGVLLS